MAIRINFHPIAWTSSVIKKRSTYNISINKLVANGCNIKKGDILHSYAAKDSNNRQVIVTYLDGKTRFEKKGEEV